MKKLLYCLFLFISCNQYEVVYSQVVVTSASTGGSTSTTSTGYGTNFNGGATVNDRILYAFASSVDADVPNDPTIEDNDSGAAMTFEKLQTITYNTTGTARSRLTVWMITPLRTLSTGDQMIVRFGGQAQHSIAISSVKVSGLDLVAGDVQSATNSADATANPSVTLPSPIGYRGTVVAFFANDASTFSATPESPFTQVNTFGITVPDMAVISISANNTTDNTPSLAYASSDWAGIAIEIKSARIDRIKPSN